MECGRKDFAELGGVGGAEDAPLRMGPPGEAEVGGEVVAVAGVGNLSKVLDFSHAELRVVAQAGGNGEVVGGTPIILHEPGVVPTAEAAGEFAKAEGIAAGKAEAEVFDRGTAEIIAEEIIAAVGAGFAAIEVEAREGAAGAESVAGQGALVADGEGVAILHAVNRDGGAGAEFFKGGADLHLGADGVGLRHEETAGALEGSGEVPDFFGVAGVGPGEAGVVVLRGGVGILAGDELEGIQGLVGPGVAGEEAMFAEVLVQAEAGGLGIEGLGGVGVEGAFVDVGAIGLREGPGVVPAIDEIAGAGVRGEAGAFVGTGYEDIAIDVAAAGLDVTVERKVGVLPEPETEAAVEDVLASGEDVADLEEAAGREDGIGVGPGEGTVETLGLRVEVRWRPPEGATPNSAPK